MADFNPIVLGSNYKLKQLNENDNLLIPSNKLVTKEGDLVSLQGLNGILTTKEPLGFLDRESTTISFDDSTVVFTLAPSSGSFTFYNQENKVIVSSNLTVTVSTTEGVHYVSIDNTNALVESTTGFTNIPVAIIYYDATNNKSIFLADARKIIGKDINSFNVAEQYKVAKLLSGFDITATLNGDGSSDSHAQIGLNEGFIEVYNKLQQIVDSTAANPYTQVLTNPAKIPLFYRVNTNEWRFDSVSYFPVSYDGTNPINYNSASGLTAAANNSYVPIYLVLTNNIYNPIIGIIGKNYYSTLEEAIVNDSLDDYDLSKLPLQRKLVYKLIFKTSTGFSNTPKAILVYINDYRYLEGNKDYNNEAQTVKVDTSNFTNNLSSSDITVQKALETLDQLSGTSSLTPADFWYTFDGSGNTITLPHTPVGKVMVSRDGAVIQKEGSSDDYTISGNVITINDTAANLNGITYYVYYLY